MSYCFIGYSEYTVKKIGLTLKIKYETKKELHSRFILLFYFTYYLFPAPHA